MSTTPGAPMVAYYRVSTDRQGRSGLGLDAQRESVGRHVVSAGGVIIGEFTEVESASTRAARTLKKRPELRAALEMTKARKAVLVIAKLDRLARNVAFGAGLMESGVEFIACDMPSANRFMLHVMMAVAEHEGRIIAERTRSALAQAKAQGTVLGKMGKIMAARHKADALERLSPVKDWLLEMRRDRKSYRQIAAELNEMGVPSPGDATWHASTVFTALSRLN